MDQPRGPCAYTRINWSYTMQIVELLQVCKKLSGHVEGIAERGGHVRGNVSLAVEQRIKLLNRHAKNVCEINLRPAASLQFLHDERPRMVHGRYFILCLCHQW